MSIASDHPLRRLFQSLVLQRLGPGLPDRAAAAYVANLLTDFVHVDQLYRIRNAQGRPLEDVAEMLLESNPLLNAPSFIREREVRKHIGDFTLFFSGLFPEWVRGRPRRRRQPLDAFVDYVQTGRESYRIVAAFDQFEYAAEAPLFRRLADRFEFCVFGLNQVCEDLRRLQTGYYRSWRDAFGLSL